MERGAECPRGFRVSQTQSAATKLVFREMTKGAKLLGNVAERVSGAAPMGHNKGKDNVKKRAKRRKKAELVAMKSKAKASA
jgi:hypothetical protein